MVTSGMQSRLLSPASSGIEHPDLAFGLVFPSAGRPIHGLPNADPRQGAADAALLAAPADQVRRLYMNEIGPGGLLSALPDPGMVD